MVGEASNANNTREDVTQGAKALLVHRIFTCVLYIVSLLVAVGVFRQLQPNSDLHAILSLGAVLATFRCSNCDTRSGMGVG